MANSLHIIPFIKAVEGGLSKTLTDTASNFPLPDGSGYHTNKGVTWKTWCSIIGSNAPDSIKRFYTMSDADWAACFQPYWKMILGNSIKSQRIADVIVDWVWCSGKHYPEIHIQDILVHSFGEHVRIDGNFGPVTIAVINLADETKLYQAILNKRFWYMNQLVATHPTNAKFLKGWNNRMNNLIAFEAKGESPFLC